MMIKQFFTILITFTLFGCHVPLISKESLKVPTEPKTITLPQPISKWQNYIRHGNIEWVAKAGKYVAVFENANGTFFKGENDCIEQRAENGRLIITEDGGLWIKSPELMTARIFAFEGTRTAYSEEGKPTQSEKGAANKITNVQVVGSQPSTNIAAGAVSSVVVTLLTQLDPERIMFQSDEFDVHNKFNFN